MSTVIQHDELNDVVEIRGASGARILVGPKHTMKFDVERTRTFVRDQGAWLTGWQNVELLPRVTEVFSTGYTMETVRVPRLDEVNVLDTCELMLRLLREQLWCKAAPNFRSGSSFPQDNGAYVQRLVDNVEEQRARQRVLTDRLREFRREIDWDDVRYGMTHGDAILDNVGFRAQGELVILDPIPASYALPNWSSVDVGRIIQSMVGYESVRYARSHGNVHDYDAAVATVLNWYMPKNFKVNEARACLYFAIIHMLRAARTTLPGTAARLGIMFLVNKLIEVTKQWMR